MNHRKKQAFCLLLLVGMFATAFKPMPAPPRQVSDDANPPDHVVKLIFIHHSTGQQWLENGHGGLGLELAANNYHVSDIHYNWGPVSPKYGDVIGNYTDIPDWVEWFASASTPTYMNAVFNESDRHTYGYSRPLANPGGENEIIIFKSCFLLNSDLTGDPDDPPATSADYSVGGAKYVYNTILQYFAAHPDKLFVVVTAPPVQSATYAANARAFNEWLVNDWLDENNYTMQNVAVFDFYNVLTHPNAHHRFINGQVEHDVIPGSNTLYYPKGISDDHPSAAGSQKATDEFVPMLNVFYHRYLAGKAPATFNKSSPADSASNQMTNLSLTWSASSGPAPITSYQYCYDTVDDDICNTEWVNNRLKLTANLRRLTPDTIYYWQARAVNSFNFTEADTDWYSFTTDTLDTSTFTSVAANDGWALESSEYSSRANSRSPSGNLLVGDNAKNRQYRSLLYFDTSSLPDDGIVYNATLKIMRAGVTGTDPFTTHGDLFAEMKNGYFGKSLIENTDFQAVARPKRTIGTFTPINGEPDWYELALNAANVDFVNIKGVTQFRIRLTRDDDNDKIADFISFYSGDDVTNPPELIVEYVAP